MAAEPSLLTESETETERARRDAQSLAQAKIARTEAQLSKLLEVYERQRELSQRTKASFLLGEERWYSAAETAQFFARTPAWIYDRLAKEVFKYNDGTPIKPVMVGDGPRPRRRFNLDLVLAIVRSMYRDGTVKLEEMKLIKQRIAAAEFAEYAYDPDFDLDLDEEEE